MICHITLEPLKKGIYSEKVAKGFFHEFKPIESLPFSRKEFFTEGSKYVDGMSISGVQQKLSLKINENNIFEMVSKGGTYILKPSPESFPFAAENEQCAMAVSRMLGIPTAFCAAIPFSDGEYAYITERYDRTSSGKLQQEDLAQGFNLPKSEKYSRSYEEALELVHRMSGGKLSVVRDLFNRIVFAYLIGNDDMHLKNMSLIKRKENMSLYFDTLTPNYDQLFASSFENRSSIGFLALDLLKEENDGRFTTAYEKFGFYTSTDFMLLGRRAGLPDGAIKGVFNHYFSREQDILDMIHRSFMPDTMRKRASSVVVDRIKALKL